MAEQLTSKVVLEIIWLKMRVHCKPEVGKQRKTERFGVAEQLMSEVVLDGVAEHLMGGRTEHMIVDHTFSLTFSLFPAHTHPLSLSLPPFFALTHTLSLSLTL